jgi:hypothetical protein
LNEFKAALTIPLIDWMTTVPLIVPGPLTVAVGSS